MCDNTWKCKSLCSEKSPYSFQCVEGNRLRMGKGLGVVYLGNQKFFVFFYIGYNCTKNSTAIIPHPLFQLKPALHYKAFSVLTTFS